MIKHVAQISLLITLTLLVTACAPSSLPSSTSPQESRHLPESRAIPESSPLPEAPSEKPDSAVQQALDTKLENAFSVSLLELLASKFDLSPHLNHVLADGDVFHATLVLENSAGQSYTEDIQGHLTYNASRPTAEFFIANWGGICIVDPDTIAVITLDCVTLLDARSLEEKPFPPGLSFLEENMNIVGVGRCDDEYIVAVVAREPGEGTSGDRNHEYCFLFDHNGKLMETISMGLGNIFARYYSFGRELYYAEQIFMPIWEKQRYLVIPNRTMAYPIDDPRATHCLFAARYDNGDDTLLIADLPFDAGVAFLYEQDVQTSAVALPRCNPGVFDSNESESEEGGIDVRWGDNRTATVEHPHFDTAITLDFTSNTADVVYQLQPDHIHRYDDAYPPPSSPDERYRIVESSIWSSGQAADYYNAWLHDMESDRYSFIDVFTSSYGGYGDLYRFFDSKQFYRIIFPGQLMIYEIADSKPNLLHLLSDNAIAVTYAADRGYYYVLELVDKQSVNVAIWSDSGDLVSRHNTAIPVTHHYEGYFSPAISVSGNTMYYESPHLEIRIKGTLDLTTFEFLETSRQPLRP